MSDKKKSPVGGPGLPAGVKSSGDKLNERELKRSQTYVAQNPPPENRPTKQGNQKKTSPVGGPGLPKTQTVRYTVTPNSGVKRGASVGKTVSSARNTVENQKLDRREAKRSERYKEEEAQRRRQYQMPAWAAMRPDEFWNPARHLVKGGVNEKATDEEIAEGQKLFEALGKDVEKAKSVGLVQVPKADAKVKLARFYAVGEILAKWYEERGMTQEMYDVRSRVSNVRWQEAQGRFGYHSEPGGGDAYRDAQARAKADGFAKKYVGKRYDNFGDDWSDWWNRFGANFTSGWIGIEGAAAATAYAKNPTPGNKYYRDTIKNVSGVYHGKNDGIVGSGGLFNKSVASQLPHFLKQAEARVKGEIVGGMLGYLTGGDIGKGMKWGAVASSGIYAYEQAYGYSFVNLSEQTDFETAKKLAHDEAVLSSGVEMADTAIDAITLGRAKVLELFGKEAAKKIGKESLLKILGKYAVETLGEGAEEGLQEILSIANERRLSNGDVDSGVFGLLAECKNVIRDMAAGKSPDDVERVKESAHEGVKVGAVMGGAQLGVNTAISSVAGQNGAQVPPNAKNPAAETQQNSGKVTFEDAAGQGNVQSSQQTKKSAAEAQQYGNVVSNGAAETQQDGGKVTFEDVVNSGKGDTEPDVVFMTGAGAKNSPKYDYTKPFSQQVDDFKNKKIPKDDSLLVGGTGDVYQSIGLNALPMAIDQTHVDYMLNGTKDSDHSLGEAFLKQLPEAMQKPIAIIASESRPTESIVALLPFVHNGKTVIAPVEIDGESKFNNVRFDVNAISSVYAKSEKITSSGKTKWEAADMLNSALSEEAKGNISVYYWNKNEALTLLQRTGLQRPGSLPKGGFIHSIRENGSKVNPKFENVTESQQFRRWFKNSDVTGMPPSKIVDSDGKPAAKFYQEMRRTSSGDYLYVFSGNEATASRLPQTPKAIDSKSAYLNVARPMKETITAAQYRDAQFMAGLVSLAKKNRHDGLILDLKENGRKVDTIFAVFDKAQMKSTENMGSFFRDTSDPMYSAGTELDEEYVSPENAVVLKEAEETFGRLGFTVTTVPHVENMPENVDGYVDFTNKEVYINPKAENAQEVVIKHELTHILERSRGSRYVRSAMDAIKRKMPKAWEEAYQKNWEKYEKLSESNPDLAPTRARIESETLADFSVYFAKDDVIRHYAMNHENRSFIQTMKDFYDYIVLQAKVLFEEGREAVFWNSCARKWEKALDVAVQDDGNVHDSGNGADYGVQYTINEIEGEKGNYGVGVFLDTPIFNRVKPRDWGKVLNKFVYENLIEKKVSVYDEGGNEQIIEFARKNDRVWKDGAKNSHKVIDKLARKSGNAQILSVVHVEEMLQASKFEDENSDNVHGWFDENGWEYRKVYVQDVKGVIFEATLNIARARDGRNILYDISNVKEVDRGVVPSIRKGKGLAHKNQPLTYSLSQDKPGVNSYSMQETEKDADDVSFMVSDSGAGASSGRTVGDIVSELEEVARHLDDASLSEEEYQKLDRRSRQLEIALTIANARESAGAKVDDNGFVAQKEAEPKRRSSYHVDRLRDAVERYRETGDTSGIPTKKSVDASKKRYVHKLDQVHAELAEAKRERLHTHLTSLERENLEGRIKELENMEESIRDANQVLSKVSDVLSEIDTEARPNHRWVEDIAPGLVDKKNLIKYGTYGFNDFERNLRNFFGKHFPKVKEKILDPLYRSKKRYAEYVESYSDRIYNEVVKGLGIKKGSKLSEAVQWLGEGEKPAGKKLGEKISEKWYEENGEYEPYDYERCRKEFGAETADRIQQAADIFRECYDKMLDDINATRAKIYPNNPEKLILKRNDYFRHFQEMNNSLPGLIQTVKNHAGISPELVGVSEHTKPKSKWASFGMAREGKKTKIDAVGGFLDYLPQAAHAVHIDPNIVNIRSLAYDLAMVKAKDGENGNPNANSFIRYLQNYANKLAGKTVDHFDRKLADSTLGRPLLAAASWFNNRAKANAVLGNFSSMLSQFANIANIVGEIKHESDVLRGAMDAGLGLFGNKAVRAEYENSGFLKERFLGKKIDRFDRYGLTRLAADALGIADEVGTRITWCAALREAERLGVSDKYAYADSLTRRCVAGRGIGEVPLEFESTVSKLFLPFRLEVNNNINVYRDILFGEDYDADLDVETEHSAEADAGGDVDFDKIVEAGQKKKPGKGKNAAVRTKNILRLFVFSAIMNAIMGALKSDEFDPLEDLFGGEDEEEEKDILEKLRDLGTDYLDGAGDGVLFDPLGAIARGVYQGWNEDSEASSAERFLKGGLRGTQNVLGDWVSNDPLAQVVIGGLGVDSKAIDTIFNDSVYIPAGSGMPAASSFAKAVSYLAKDKDNPQWGSSAVELLKAFGTPWGGGQLDKTARGLYEYFKGATTKRPYERMYSDDEGNLKYLVEPNAENLLKSILFGPSSFSGANDAYYNSDYKKRLDAEDSAAVLKLDGYGAQKDKFDEIIAEKDFNSKETKENAQESYAEEYKVSAGEDSPIYQMYKNGFVDASPYNKVQMDLEGTINKHKFSCELTVEEAAEATDELTKRISERFLSVEDSAAFLAMSEKEKEELLSDIHSREYYLMRAELALEKGAISEEDYAYQVKSHGWFLEDLEELITGEKKSTGGGNQRRSYSGSRRRRYSGGGRSLRASSGYSFRGNGYGYTGSSSYSGGRRGGNRTSSGSAQKSSGTTKASGSGLGSLTFDDIMYHVKSSSGSSGSLGSGSGTAKTRSGVTSKAQNGLRTKIKTSLRKTDFDDIL